MSARLIRNKHTGGSKMFIGIIISILFMTYLTTFKEDFNDKDVGVITVAVVFILALSFIMSLL